MPMKPARPCRKPGCPGFCAPGKTYCDKHLIYSEERLRERNRATSAERGYSTAWQKARKAYLQKHPLCVECQRYGRLTPATVVDHIIPHKGDKKLFWDSSNWQSLCQLHHNQKTGHGE